MMSSVDILNRVWSSIAKALRSFERGSRLPSSQDVVDVINNSEVEEAKRLIKEYKLD